MQTVITTGYLVVTAITDNIGRTTYQHSKPFLTEAEAQAACLRHMPALCVWEREIAQTVRTCRTAFPAEAVAARNAAEMRAAA